MPFSSPCISYFLLNALYFSNNICSSFSSQTTAAKAKVGCFLKFNNSAFNLAENATSILKNYAKMILDWGCAGSISENIHAEPDSNGNPIHSGTFSQAWSVSEFVRNIFQDVVGFVPRLAEGKICINPKLPANCKNWKATIPFGKNWELNVSIKAVNSVYECEVL